MAARTESLIELIYEATIEPKKWAFFAEAWGDLLGGAAVMLSLPHPRAGARGEIIAPALPNLPRTATSRLGLAMTAFV